MLAAPLAVANQSSRNYALDSSQSKFVARAFAGGLLWFKGKDHLVAVREFTGEAQITPGSITPASLEITAKAASMVETREVFTAQRSEEHTSNSSHSQISYAVFCLKK